MNPFTHTHSVDTIVVGSGLTGLTTALLLARAGHPVTVLERDTDPPPEHGADAWRNWQRPGVNQFRQPHLMLPRWLRTVRDELPELPGMLLAAGARPVNLLHLQQLAVTQGWQPGDEAFDTLAVRRPVLEACLARLAVLEPGVTLRRGARVAGLQLQGGPGPTAPRVCGVRLGDGTVSAGLVVDCAGRRTPVPELLARAGVVLEEYRDPAGLIYWSRHFRTRDGRTPTGLGAVLTHHASLSVLTLPGDDGTFCIVLVTRADDRELRSLRHVRVWERVAARTAAAAWLDLGEPTSGVLPIAGIEDVTRSYVRDGRPLVRGLVAVGDSAVATNPSLGRGASLGALQAVVLRDALAEAPTDVVQTYADAWADRVQPWIDATTWFDRHRLAEMGAEAGGDAYASDDIGWAMSGALRRGAVADPVLARASSRIGGLLALPPDALSDPEVGRRLAPWLTEQDDAGPSRTDLVEAATTTTAGSAGTSALKAEASGPISL